MLGPPFAMFACQRGAEPAVKADLTSAGWTLAFSRPGFVTMKAAGSVDRLPESPFARSSAWALGQTKAVDPHERCGEVLSLVGTRAVRGLHVWQRDQAIVGRGFEPFPSADALATDEMLRGVAAGIGRPFDSADAWNIGDQVLDVVIVDEQRWWVGVHAITEDPATRWAGGVPPLTPQAEVVSRAYYKLAEAILWSGLPIRANDHAAEIGCAPGGASQYLLERGLHVLGVDPAIVDRRVASHAGFRHLRARGGDLPRREFRHCKWLFVDANVAPDKSLTTIENLVTNPQVRIRGIIVQLKLSDYEHHRELPHWIARVQSWGYRQTACRQLAFNRRELTLAARWPREPRKPGEGAAAMTGSAGQSAAESASEN